MLVDASLIADRYQLLERLGAGSMGEVWKARDLRFGIAPRFVALKLLKEDNTRREDATNRERLSRALADRSAGPLSVAFTARLLHDFLDSSRGPDDVRSQVEARAAAAGGLRPDDVLGLFDELVDDPSVCANARMRAKIRRLFEHEANSVANLHHENIAGISDYGVHEGTLYLAMDYVEGQTLQRVIQRGELDRVQQLRLMEDLCAGLAYAHKRQLVHRDIKPANLIVDQERQTLKILDFGVVRRLQDTGESTTGVPIGTLSYMSPEQIVGSASVDGRSDVFSVGAVFYELLTGRKAFPPGEGLPDLMARIRRSPPQPVRDFVPDIEPEILAILDRALEKDPDRRYQDLTEMQRDLARVRMQLETDTGDQERTLVIPGARPRGSESAEPLIPRLLRQGERALGENSPTLARDCAAQILALDPTNHLAQSLSKRANAALRLRQVRLGLDRGRPQLDAGDLTGARAIWRTLVAIDPESEEVQAFGAAVSQAEAQREKVRLLAKREAERQAAEARERLEAEVAQLLRRCDELTTAGEIEVAIELLNPVRAWHPDVAARLVALEKEQVKREWQAREERRRREEEEEAERRRLEAEEQQRRLEEEQNRRHEAEEQRRREAREEQRRLREEEERRQRQEREPLEEFAAEPTLRNERFPSGVDTRTDEQPASWPFPSAFATGPQTLVSQTLIHEADRDQQTEGELEEEHRARQGGDEEGAHVWAEPQAERPRPEVQEQPQQRLAERLFGWRSWAVAGAVVVFVAVGMAAYVQWPRLDTAVVPAPPPPIGGVKGIDPPKPPPPVATSVVTIDIRPWARVRVVGRDGATAPPDVFTTPFTLNLQPGKYTLRCENGDVTKPADFDIEVAAGEPASVIRTMPGFNVDRIVDELLGQAP